MPERKLPRLTDPVPLACQVSLKELTDEMLGERPNPRDPSMLFNLKINPAIPFMRLRQSSLADLLLDYGESLSAENPDEHFPDIDLTVGFATRRSVGVQAYGFDKIPTQEAKKPYWQRELSIVFFYGNNDANARHLVTISDYLPTQGELPLLSRSVWAPRYNSQEYEGHNRTSRSCRDEGEANFFIDLVRDLYRGPHLVPATV